MTSPTHQFCPNCNAMLPPTLEVCPRCEHKISGGSDMSLKEIFQMTGMFLLVAAVPMIILIGVSILCVNSFR